MVPNLFPPEDSFLQSKDFRSLHGMLWLSRSLYRLHCHSFPNILRDPVLAQVLPWKSISFPSLFGSTQRLLVKPIFSFRVRAGTLPTRDLKYVNRLLWMQIWKRVLQLHHLHHSFPLKITKMALWLTSSTVKLTEASKNKFSALGESSGDFSGMP